MTFAYPLALLWPIAFILWIKISKVSVTMPVCSDAERLKSIAPSFRQRVRAPLLWMLQLGALGLLSIAALRPQDVTVIPQIQNARNLMLVIDVSESMGTEDFQYNGEDISRMQAIKLVVSSFIEARHNDRLGLAIFGERAFLQSPLTLDHGVLVQLVKGLEPGMVGPATAIGDGLGVALKRLEAVKEGSKAIILLTDGVNNAGTVKPLQAAQIAKDLSIKIHTIGIGSTAPVRRTGIPGIFGSLINNQQQAEFDEATLKKIAKQTNGVYFNASDVEKLQAVYKEIDALESSDEPEQTQSVVHEYYAQFAAWGLACLTLLFVLSSTVLRRYP